MLLEVENIYTRVLRGNDDELAWLSAVLSYADTRGMFVRNPETGKTERKTDAEGNYIAPPSVSLLHPGKQTFPTGLLHRPREDAKKHGYHLEFRDMRKKVCDLDFDLLEEWCKAHDLELRKSQLVSIEKFAITQRGLIELGTGAGKTIMTMGIIAAMPGVKWLCICPNTQLMTNMSKAYCKFFPGETPGRIHGTKSNTTRDLVLTTPKTLLARLQGSDHKAVKHAVKNEFTGLIFDEVHRAAGDAAYKCVMATTAAYTRLGLSATVGGRSDNRTIFVHAGFGKILHKVPAKELIAEGVLAEPTINIITVEQTGPSSLGWQEDYQTYIVSKHARVRYAAYAWTCQHIVSSGETPCLALAWSQDHVKNCYEIAKALGYITTYVYGKTKAKVRDEVKEALDSGEYQIVVASEVFVEGVDSPNMRSLIRLGGKKAEVSTIQGLGRALRITDTKPTVNIYELMDKVPHGELEQKPGNYYNHRHSVTRRHQYLKEGHKVIDLKTFKE